MGAPSRVLISAGLIFALAVPAMAGDAGTKDKDKDSVATSAPRPKPAAEKKIYTNEDLEALAARYGASTVGQAAPQALPAPLAARPIPAQSIAQRTAIVTLPPEKDPARYARDYAALEAAIDAIDSEVAQLRNFRASDAAPGAETPGVTVGLDIYAPCNGISTDNKIANLLQQRAALELEISNLEDTAQANGIRLGQLLSAASAAESGAAAPSASPAVAQAELAQIETRLATIQGEQNSFQQAAANSNAPFTIAPETKFGGTYQSSYLKRLDNQSSALQSQLSAVEDEARRSGVPPATLP
jgi:hypothetical protein